MAENETNRETVVPFAHMPRPHQPPRPPGSKGGPADAVVAWAEVKNELKIDAERLCTPEERLRVMQRYSEKWGGNCMGTVVVLPNQADSRQNSPRAGGIAEVTFGEIGKTALVE